LGTKLMRLAPLVLNEVIVERLNVTGGPA